jgi:hypothetical protein
MISVRIRDGTVIFLSCGGPDDLEPAVAGLGVEVGRGFPDATMSPTSGAIHDPVRVGSGMKRPWNLLLRNAYTFINGRRDMGRNSVLAVFALFLIMLIPAGVSALVTYSGGQVIISEPVNDDVFVTGGTIVVDAPIYSLIAAGGTVEINAPVRGDAIAAGGKVDVNGDVGGKVVAAGGTVNINRRVGTNAVLAGGQVNIGKDAVIFRDAMITGGQVAHAGQVAGNLTARAQSFDNSGTAGKLDIQLSEPNKELSFIFTLFGIVFSLGMFILGLVLLHISPKWFLAVEDEVRKSALVKTISGFFGIIISFIALILISITIVLLPLAIALWAVFLIGLLLSTLFVSLALGRIIARYTKWAAPAWQMFTGGFIILSVVFRIPVLGILVLIISVSLGTAALFWTIYLQRDTILGRGVEG